MKEAGSGRLGEDWVGQGDYKRMLREHWQKQSNSNISLEGIGKQCPLTLAFLSTPYVAKEMKVDSSLKEAATAREGKCKQRSLLAAAHLIGVFLR